MKIRAVLIALLAAASLPLMGAAQLACNVPSADQLEGRPSPYDSATATVGGSDLKVCYGRPSLRGRPMIGGVLPYGSLWRVGANEATALHLSFGGHVAGVAVEPGSYSLFVDLNEDEWTLHVNSNWDRWGVPIDDGVLAADVGTGSLPVERIDQAVETLMMWFDVKDDANADLVIDWQNTRVRVPIHKM